MNIVGATQINSFAPVAQQTDVSPEEPIFVLTGSQLQEIISRAIQPIQDEAKSLKDTIAIQGEKMAALESRQDLHADNQLIQLRLIKDLQKKEPGKTEISRAEKIEKYLQVRPDHRATFETLKGHLGIDNDLLGIAIKSLLPSGRYAVIKTPGDKRKRTLVMLSR